MNIKYPFENPHTLSVDEISKTFQTNDSHGLTSHEAGSRNTEFGLNLFEAQAQKSIWIMFLEQFKSPIVYLLAFAALVSGYFKNYVEAIAIFAVILINAIIGFLMEMQARSSMNALKKMDIIKSKVMRDGKIHEIPSEKITPGDLIMLEAGDVIPGDGRLVESNQLQCDESSLTGESLPTLKNIEVLPQAAVLGDQFNMVFKGSSVMNGNGKAIITGIAKNTELGKITSLVESSAETKTPLDKKLASLSKKLIWITIFMTSIFAVTGFIQGKNWLIILETSIALAVAAFPEGLPIVSTVALSYGILLMAKRNAIVKKLSAVETLGSTSVILTDKTGTLTENKIYVDTFCFPEESIKASIENNVLKFLSGEIKSVEAFEKIKLVGALCNNASSKLNGKKEKTIGDPVEIALIHLANTSETSLEEIYKNYPRIGEIPFDADTKMMATLHKSDKGNFVAAKGAVEQLLAKCTKILSGDTIKDLSKADRKKILEESEMISEEGLRVLGFAFHEEATISDKDYLNDLVYVGSIGFLDPPRLDIKKAIITCRNAGIKVVMITGDHPKTALNIAKKVGLVDENEENVITGSDLPETKSFTKDWKNKILACSVFARTTPKQKLDIADVFQKAGNIVAMTGDGVNDAPALKKADVGIAMGLRGTQVAKETASIVLKNDSFTSIAEAVGHGREIFNNIKKFVVYLVSCNISEIFLVTTLGFLAPASTVLPLQILFLNMVTDVFPALALGLGKGDKTVMKKPPRDSKEDIVTNKDWISIGIYSAIITLSVILGVFYCKEFITKDHKILNNVAFVTLAFAQLFHVFNMSAPNSKLINNEVTKNHFVWYAIIICSGLMAVVFAIPQLRLVLGLADLPVNVWVVCISASLVPLVLVQAYKVISTMFFTKKMGND
jgi:P-type Ca2+ transporter type 2C